MPIPSCFAPPSCSTTGAAPWRGPGGLSPAALLLLPQRPAPASPTPLAARSRQPQVRCRPSRPRSRVGLLLPLSGGNRALGEAMLNAAQLALFDQADPAIEFLPRDTGSTPAGAAEAPVRPWRRRPGAWPAR